MAAPFLTAQIRRLAAKHRLAVSSVASVASGYELSCVFLNADAYRFSRPANVICADCDR
jgi:hypothetical protein